MFTFVTEKVLPLATPDKTLVVGIFSHGMAIRCFLRKVLDLNPSQVHFSLENTSVTEIVYQDGLWIVKELNGATHLKKVVQN